MGGVTDRGQREADRRISLMQDGTLIVEEGRERFKIGVTTSACYVTVGCTRISREAWEEIVRRVEKS
jgi:hypothetical protein